MAASRAVSSARSSPWSGSRSWTWRNAVSLPPAEADQEGHRPGGGGQPGRLGVEADQRHVRRRLPGECRQPGAVDRQGTAGRLAPDDDALGPADDLTIDRGSQPAGEVLAALARDAPRWRPGGRPIAVEPAGQRRRAVDHGRAAPAVAPSGCAQLGQQSQGQRAGIDVDLETWAGARRAAHVAAAHGDQLGGCGDELVVPVPQPLAEPDPARDRLVQVDGRLFGVRRADLGHETEVARVDHQADRRDGLDRATGAEQRDVELVAAPVRRASASAVSQ